MGSRVSVVLPVFNAEHTIEDTMNSVLGQSHEDLEIIVVNDGSDDGTASRIEKFLPDERIRYSYQENAGAAHARNSAISLATGEYIAFIDADDLWAREKTEKQLALFHRSSAGLVFTDGEFFGEDQEKSGDLFSMHEKPHRGNVFRNLLLNNFIPSLSVIVRKKVLEEVGMFRTHDRLVVGEDYDLWLRIARKYQVEYCPEPLFRYRLSGGSLSADRKKTYDNLMYLYANWAGKDLDVLDRVLCRYGFAKAAMKYVICLLKQRGAS